MTAGRRHVAALAVAAGVLAACAYGETGTTAAVTDVNADLRGTVRSTVTEPTDYWFEYGTTAAYGSTTPVRTETVGAGGRTVQETVAGLAEATTYHYRLCTRGADRLGLCGADATFGTSSDHDSVTGSGTIIFIPPRFGAGASVDARLDTATGEVDGSAGAFPGTWAVQLPDGGPVTCLTVSGNRATVGFAAVDPVGSEPPIPRLLFIEDNGPTGDRLTLGSGGDPDVCPAPTDAVFQPIFLGGFAVGPGLQSGDFVVHDHQPG